MLDGMQYRILKQIAPSLPSDVATAYLNKSKLRALLGDRFFGDIVGKTVVDFGCGEGDEAVEIAENGAARVIGIDIREDVLETARRKAHASGLANACTFTTADTSPADLAVSIDAFEHFGDPGEILKIMSTLVKPNGRVYVSFGPTWYHPLGGHLFSVFPWAHLIFSEKALIRWRSDFKTDGATTFAETAGGLNQMTIKRFIGLVAKSPFQFESLDLVPIRQARRFHTRLTREFFTSIVRCRLLKRDGF